MIFSCGKGHIEEKKKEKPKGAHRPWHRATKEGGAVRSTGATKKGVWLLCSRDVERSDTEDRSEATVVVVRC